MPETQPSRNYIFLLACILFAGITFSKPNIVQSNFAVDCSKSQAVPQADCEALVDLYNNTNGPEWAFSTNWLTIDDSTDVCNWGGVFCENGSVLDLNLSSNNLSGTLPTSIGTFTNLQFLDLSGNQISGSIPPEIANLTELKWLVVYDNQINGDIPPELGSMPNLQVLELNLNPITGNIPTEIGNASSLVRLVLFNTNISGTIPKELGQLQTLEHLDLGKNQLEGPIPPELGNLASLGELFIIENNVSGEIPVELGNLTNLFRLGIWDTNVSGSIPSELSELTGLTYLNLRTNNLVGQIPQELESLTSLNTLILSQNELVGTIPSSFSNFSSLNDFYFNETDLCVEDSSPIQTWLSSVSTVVGTDALCGSISGIVRDGENEALGDVEVTVLRIIDSTPVNVSGATTNPDGTYTVSGVSPRTDYLVSFSSSTPRFVTEYFGESTSIGGASEVSVSENATTEDIDVILDQELDNTIYLPNITN